MLTQFAQPKGSTIGLLKDGRTVEEAILELTTLTTNGAQAVSPKGFGAVAGQDATLAINSAATAAAAQGKALDLRGGPWKVSGTLDFTNVRTVVSDASGVINVDNDNFTSKFTNRYAITFGNPDVAYGSGRSGHVQVLGTLVVNSMTRTTPLHGVYFKGSWFGVGVIRANGFNGSAIVMEAVWDSIFGSLSGELSGNVADYQIDVRGGGDTSNCIFVGRIQSERAYHKCLRLSAIRSVFNTIHAERTAVLTVDDGSTLADGVTKYMTLQLNLGNSVVNQLIHDAITGNAPDGQPTVGVASARLDMDFANLNAAALGSCIVNTNSGRNSQFTSVVAKKWTFSSTATDNVISNVRITDNLAAANMTTFIGGTIETLTPRFNASDLLFDNVAIKQLNFAADIKGNIRFRSCRFPETMTIGTTRAPEGYSATSTLGETNLPVTFENCILLGAFVGAFQSRAVWEGGYIKAVNLVSRAAVEFYGTAMGSFDCTGDIAYVTRQCRAATASNWARTTHVAYPIGTITERLGVDSGATGLAFRNTDGTAAGWTKIY